jgi:hypothetical protein
MFSKFVRRVALLGVLACGAASTGCATSAAGHANFSLASTRVYGAKDGVTVIKHVDREMCSENAVLLFFWGDAPDHEYLIKTILEETGGDAITNASLTFTALPLILYNENCVEVEGDVVRFPKAQSGSSGAPAGAPGDAPASPPTNPPTKEDS